jgi:hypothetical protein
VDNTLWHSSHSLLFVGFPIEIIGADGTLSLTREACERICIVARLVQMHGRNHNATCFKTKSAMKSKTCRFNFPRSLVEETHWDVKTSEVKVNGMNSIDFNIYHVLLRLLGTASG